VATTIFREDYLGRDLIAPTTAALDYLGRVVTSTTGYSGIALRRVIRPISSAVTLNQEIQVTDNKKYIVTVAGTTGASDPTPPAVGATVADGTATLLRTK
jgi:tryptophan synthase alpha subunit